MTEGTENKGGNGVSIDHAQDRRKDGISFIKINITI